jgi:peptide/nickel transport system permease protein
LERDNLAKSSQSTEQSRRFSATELLGLPPSVAMALVVVFLFLIAAVLGDRIAPYSAIAQNIGDRLQAPSWADHWLGTDQLGRDIFSRIIVGARPTAIVAAACTLIGGGLGGLLGILAGYFGRMIDTIIMRAADATLSFPTLLLALIFAVVSGPGIGPVIATISFLIWARFARVVRAATLTVRHRDWIRQARVNGCSDPYIIARHVVPHVLDTWLVIATMQIGAVILLEASLGFLGIGVPPPDPSWGQMSAAGRNYLAVEWWVSLFPAIAITFVIIAFSLIGDWLRDRLDPRAAQA